MGVHVPKMFVILGGSDYLMFVQVFVYHHFGFNQFLMTDKGVGHHD